MASDSGDSGDDEGQGRASHEPRECMACRGSGSVISNLGASPSSVTCPWCGGEGLRRPDVDAQAHWGPQAAGHGAARAEGESAPT